MQRAKVRPAIRPKCAGCGRLAGQPVEVVARDTPQADPRHAGDPPQATRATLVLCSSCIGRPHMLIWRKWTLA